MGALGKELRDHTDEIVQRWYQVWRQSTCADASVTEAALKDDLPQQLKIIGTELQDLQSAEDPAKLWTSERLDPEKRVEQHTPIQEVVQEYALAVRTVRDWIDERGIDVEFLEYSYFYEAIFELTAEAVRRYAERQAELIRHDRAHYLAGVMHQLRTPLAALALQNELAAEDEATRLDENFISRQQRNVRRIEALVNRVLRLERFLPGEFPVHPEEVFPARLIDEMMSDQQKAAAGKELRLEAHVDRSLRMKVDPGLFYDVLGNLLDNAIKYTERGQVIVEAEEGPDTVVFRVRDTGPGLAPERQKSLFKEVQPGRAGGGIGIGLQIAQHAVEAQGGTISLESEPGKGTTFSVCLPKRVAFRNGG